jgi:hypothetical protein
MLVHVVPFIEVCHAYDNAPDPDGAVAKVKAAGELPLQIV